MNKKFTELKHSKSEQKLKTDAFLLIILTKQEAVHKLHRQDFKDF